MKKYAPIAAVMTAIVCIAPYMALAQTLVQDTVTVEKAQVLTIIQAEDKTVPGINVRTTEQKVKAEVLDGPEKGQSVIFTNDYTVLSPGEVFYLRHTVNAVDGIDMYAVSDVYRLPVIWFFVGLFVVCVIIFGGKQGARGLVALAVSIFFIFALLLPGILNGYPPILVAMAVSSLIIILGSYVTHGFNRVTSSAVLGMIATIILTGILAYVAIHYGRLSGFSTEEAVYLNADTHGSIDFQGLLLGSILIGLLGVLYDAAISQAVAVDELSDAAAHIGRGEIVRRALRIGREHIGALVNTLAIAYVGASLPLLLLFYESSTSPGLVLNQELFASEIIRAMIGSIGLVLAVPITTFIAAAMLIGRKKSASEPASHTHHSHHSHHSHP